jgi:NAD(P)-dependent dehydrogenase (short-subunit alcohol dehydrogenase family)
MTMEPRNDQRVLITGGGRGLGAAIGQRLAADGMFVGLLARSALELESTVEEIVESGGQAIPLPCDVLDSRGLEESVEKFRTQAGRIDAVVCAAGGIEAIGPLRLVDLEDWARDVETSVIGTARTIRAVLPDLTVSERASISVLVGPGHHQGLKHATGYAASQAALVRLVESLGQELAPERIRVFAVNPGLVPTQMTRQLIDTPEGRRWLPQFVEAFAEGKEVSPSVVAEMIRWLIVRRPAELNGRVVASLADPEFLETRLGRILDEDLSVLRLR